MSELLKFYKKNEPTLILILGLLSYLYLFNKLVNNDYTIILLYFITLIIGYFIIKNKIYILNFFIILYDIIKTLFLKEGNKNRKKNKNKNKNKKNDEFDKNFDKQQRKSKRENEDKQFDIGDDSGFEDLEEKDGEQESDDLIDGMNDYI